jgi:hypothetical protein
MLITEVTQHVTRDMLTHPHVVLFDAVIPHDVEDAHTDLISVAATPAKLA